VVIVAALSSATANMTLVVTDNAYGVSAIEGNAAVDDAASVAVSRNQQ
jgi:hypothetical protein